MAPEPPLLSMSGITKSFPGVRALDGVDLDVQAGEVHCLLGQNGAGKSTLIKVLAGAHQPDTGTIRWRGDTVTLRSPIAAMRLGIATIYQELDLVEHLSVAENVHLGHEPTAAGFVVRSRAARASTTALLRRLGHPEIDPGALVGKLSAAQQQIVSMARALSHDVRLIVMDEPSAALDPEEVDNLFRIVGDLTEDGVAVVYISHRLEEIRRIGDRVTVLKDGRAVAGGLPVRTTPTREVVALMTGRNVEYVFPERPAAPPGGTEVLQVRGLAREGEFAPLDLTVAAGEIVGLAGLVGSGRSEILETVYGARRPTAGQVLVDGRPVRAGSVRAAVRAGIGLAPEERKAQAPEAASAPAGRGRPVLPPGRLGIQLYSLRDKVSTLGFAPVFAELEKYGYDEVEFAGYTQGSAGPITLAQLKRLARDHGLTPIGSHVGYYSSDPNAYTFAQNLTKVLDDAEALGLPHIGTASGPFRYGSTVDAWKRAAEEFNTYGAAARARGMKFYQHNHSDEFGFASDDPKVRLYDVLLAETDPDLVHLEMDIFWAYAGQFRFSKRPDGTPAPFEPLDYVLKQPHRYPLFHVKDGVSDPDNQFGYRMVDVGDGDIDYRNFISAVTRLRGERLAHHWQTEHDNPAESFTFARRSSAYLHSLREKC